MPLYYLVLMLAQRIQFALLTGFINLILVVTACAYTGVRNSFSNQLPASVQTEWVRKTRPSIREVSFPLVSNTLTQLFYIGAVHESLARLCYDRLIRNAGDQCFSPEHRVTNPFLRTANHPRSSTADFIS
jgi:hypothetical protein